MSYHTIMPALLADGQVRIVVTEVATGDSRWIHLSNADAVVLAERIEKLAKAGRKL